MAIASHEDYQLVLETVKKNKYLFPVGLDSDGKISSYFKISATPTIVFLDQNQTINWMTSGISPSLTFRVSTFLK
jgi:thioredoxin-related protein